MTPQLQIVENDIERDRKVCVKLFASITGANRELAQWLLDHPRYSAAQIAEWLGCGKTKIADLRQWAREGFVKDPTEKRRERADDRRAGDGALKSQDNSDVDDATGDDTEFAPPEEIKKNILDSIERQKAITLAYKKILKSPALDRETGDEVSTAIGGLITILQSLQRTLASRREK